MGTVVAIRPKTRMAKPMIASEIHPVLNRTLARRIIGPLEFGQSPLSMPDNEAQRISNKGYSPECVEGVFSAVRMPCSAVEISPLK